MSMHVGSPRHISHTISAVVRSGMAARNLPGICHVAIDETSREIEIRFEREGVLCPVTVGGFITAHRDHKDLAQTAIGRFAAHYEASP